MSKSAAVYVIPFGLKTTGYISYALRNLRAMVDHLIVVISPDDQSKTETLLNGLEVEEVLLFEPGPRTPAAGYKLGLSKLWDKATTVILTGSHVAGPLLPLHPKALSFAESGEHMFSPYWHNTQLDHHLKSRTQLEHIPLLDFAILSETLLQSEAFRSFWRKFTPSNVYMDELVNTSLKLAELFAEAGFKVAYPVAFDKLEMHDPRQLELHKIIDMGLPCFPLSTFLLDPLVHEMTSTEVRLALDHLREKHAELYTAVIEFITKNVPMREFNTVADQYEIFPDRANSYCKTEWSFGTIAVFIHAFYAEMMPEFWDLMQRLPCDYDVFITTSTSENKKQIESFLAARHFPATRTTVAVVEQNRGRDMSSLFISWREVVLSGRYEVALRLHSKRTPQVSRQVGESFKRHLFDNLVKSPGYVSNILDRMEAEPDIGMIIPPVIHIGFATLGHSWFNNWPNFSKLADKMGLEVPFDRNTPVAPYGTMYWFRTDAMRLMFEWDWKWEDYNPEPNHIDGGLAHVQERLIGYCVQDRGYRILSAMNPELAARYYAKLEYKLQLLASHLVSGNILHQRDQLANKGSNVRRNLFKALEGNYGSFIRRFPASHRILRPGAKFVSRMIKGGK